MDVDFDFCFRENGILTQNDPEHQGYCVVVEIAGAALL